MPNKMAVLLIEDNTQDVQAVERAFGTLFPPMFELHHATKVKDAISLIKQRDFHVVLMDLSLPDNVGLCAVEQLSQMVPSIPLIVLTGAQDEQTELRAMELGAQDFLDKNEITHPQLIRAIRHAVKRKQYALSKLGGTVNPLTIAPTRQKMNEEYEMPTKLDQLAHIIQQSHRRITRHTRSLMNTHLTGPQRHLVSMIETESKSAVADAQKHLPQEFHSVALHDSLPR